VFPLKNCTIGKKSFGRDRLILTILSLPSYSLLRCREIVRLFEQFCILNLDLSTIANFRPYTYWPLVILSCSITQHLATIFIFLSVFVRLKESSLDPRSLVWLTVISFFIGYATWNALSNQQNGSDSIINCIKSFSWSGETKALKHFFI
jgi:hypothetical protein